MTMRVLPGISLIAVLLGVVMLLASCGRKSPDVAAIPEVLAIYNGGQVTLSELETWIEANAKRDLKTLRGDYLEEMVVERLLVEEAKRKGLEETMGFRMEALRLECGRLRVALRREMHASIDIPDERLNQAAQEALQNSEIPRRIRLRNLFKGFGEEATDEEKEALRAEMEGLRARLIDGADFAAMAREHSQSSTRYDGGLLGNVAAGQLDPAIDEIVMKMTEGEVSPVLESDRGLTIFICEGVVLARKRSPEDILDRVEQKLRQQLTDRAWRELEDEWKRYSLQAPGANAWELVLSDGTRFSPDETSHLMRGMGIAVNQLASLADEARRAAVNPLALLLSAGQRARERELHQSESLQAAFEVDRRKIAVNREMSNRVGQRWVPISDAETRTYYEANRSRFVTETGIRLEVICLESSRRDRLRHSAKMRALHKTVSEDPSLAFLEVAESQLAGLPVGRAGILGPLYPSGLSALGSTVRRAIETLEIGEISSVFTQREGAGGKATLWMIRVLERIPPQAVDFETVKAGIRQHLRERRLAEIREAVREELLQGVGFEVREVIP